jgi:hypothetical protein
LDILRLKYIWGVAKICLALLSAQFFNIFCNSYGLEKFNEAATFHPIYAQKSAKIPDMFKGAKKFAKLLLFFSIGSVFCCFEHSFERQSDSF